MVAQAVVLDGHKRIVRQRGRGLPGHGINGVPELSERLVGFTRDGQLTIGVVPLLCPAGVLVDQLPERDVAPTGREIEGASPSGIPDPEGQCQLPGATVKRPIRLP
jgi:hypothetical protein